MGRKVGIDLGTTFCAVAVMDEQKGEPVIVPNLLRETITPSVIQFMEDGQVIVGADAKDAMECGEFGCVAAFKRNMGKKGAYCKFYGKSYTPVELSAILLRHLKKEAEQVLGDSIDEAVVTVPAYFYDKERVDTMEAARMAGLNIRQIINEPTAAAMNYGVNHWRKNARILVYDLGGGTFDVTLVEMRSNDTMQSLQTVGDQQLGGKDWDSRLASVIEQHITTDTALDTGPNTEIHSLVLQAAENIKRQLSAYNTTAVVLTLPGYGKYRTEITQDEFEQNTRDLLTRTGALCQNLLSGLSMTWQDVTDILLVGGSTRMPQVSAYLKSISGHSPLSQVHPDEAVALGAAIQVHLPLPEYNVISISKKVESQAPKSDTTGIGGGLSRVGPESLLGDAVSICPRDVVAHAMGVIAVNQEGTRYINKTIVPANQKIPVKCAEAFHFYTSSNPEDNEVEIYVLQGTDEPHRAYVVGKYVACNIVHDPANNPTTIRVQYSYDINGMVHVQVRQNKDEIDLPIRVEPVPEDMSKFGRPLEPEKCQTVKAEPLRVMMAIDVSGSMSGKPMRDAKKAMHHFVDQLQDYPAKIAIGVIAVSDRSQEVQSPTDNMRTVDSAIDSITECMTGICNEAHPFEDIASAMSNFSGRRLAIVLADGVWENQPTAIEKARECHRAGIDICGVGFGAADKDFLRKISSGKIESMLVQQSQLTQSFGKIAQEIRGGAPTKTGRSDGETAAETWLAIGEV